MSDYLLTDWNVAHDSAGERWIRVHSLCRCTLCNVLGPSPVELSVRMGELDARYAPSNALMAFFEHTGWPRVEWSWLGDSTDIWPHGFARPPRAHIDEFACAALMRSAIDGHWGTAEWREVLSSETAAYDGAKVRADARSRRLVQPQRRE